MSDYADYVAIRNRFESEWDSQTITTIFANGDHTDPAEDQPYVRFSVVVGDEYVAGGPDLFGRQGRIWLQIFVPNGFGQALPLELSDTFKSIFRKWRSPDGAVCCFDAVSPPATTDDKGLYQLNVGIRYESLRRE